MSTKGDKNIPYKILGSFNGKKLEGVMYEQLLNMNNQQMVMLLRFY